MSETVQLFKAFEGTLFLLLSYGLSSMVVDSQITVGVDVAYHPTIVNLASEGIGRNAKVTQSDLAPFIAVFHLADFNVVQPLLYCVHGRLQ